MKASVLLFSIFLLFQTTASVAQQVVDTAKTSRNPNGGNADTDKNENTNRELKYKHKTISASATTLDENESSPQGVITLTSRNFDAKMKDGNVWLIQFHSPWCGHCKRFAQTYSDVAAYIHNNNKDGERKILVARIDGSKERALSSRFNIRGYPTFYLVDGWDVYEFTKSRSKKALIEFARTNGSNSEPRSFFSSPFGHRAIMMNTGVRILDLYEWMVSSLGLGKTVAAVLLSSVGIFVGVVMVIVVGLCMLPKPKVD